MIKRKPVVAPKGTRRLTITKNDLSILELQRLVEGEGDAFGINGAQAQKQIDAMFNNETMTDFNKQKEDELGATMSSNFESKKRR